MDPIPKSGKYYPNKFARIAILALEDVMGRNGVNAVLNLANLPELVNQLPPDNLEKKFDFADFSAINGALELLYGARGGRGLAQRVGRSTFNDALKNFGALAGVGDLAFKVLPLQAKLRIGLPAMARIFSQASDQHSTVVEQDNHYIYTIHTCPVCWGRHSDKPDCYIAVGLLQAGLKWVSGGSEFRVNESRCIAMGDHVCEFVILKEPLA
jgi:predicted hydrocarbon binding protein